MLTTFSCPDDFALRQLVLGLLPPDEITSLQKHLAQCADCLATIAKLPTDDPLVRAMETAAAAPRPEDEAVERLIEHLRGQGPSQSGDPSTQTMFNDPAAAADTSVENRPESYDFLVASQVPDELGRLGPYRVLSVLGSGGMGIVFEAEDPELGRKVALKVMKPSMAAHPEARQRFLREARSTAAIEHDHIVTIHQVGEDRGIPYMAMQLLRGETLERRLQRNGRQPIAEVVRICREIAEGLAAAHARGLIHRDIKPANVWLEDLNHRGTGIQRQQTSDETGKSGSSVISSRDLPVPSRVKILDFGLAWAADEEPHMTQTGMVAGTPAYMAPEQASDRPIDNLCDLFSLGCVLYRLSTGELPFKGVKPLTILWAQDVKQPAPPRVLNPDVPPALSDLTLRLLAKNPQERPQSAREVVDALESIARQGDIAPRSAPWLRRSVMLAAASLLTILLGVAGYWYGATVYRLATNQGQLVIETDDPDVKVVVKQEEQEVMIFDTKTKQELTLKAGKYQVELVPEKMGLGLSAKEFTLTRGEKQIVQVRWLPPGPAHTLVGHKDVVWSAKFCLDGTHVISAGGNRWEEENQRWVIGSDFELRLWDARTGREVRRFGDHTQIVRCVAVSPDGKRAVSGGGENPKADPADWTVRLWDLETGKLVRHFKGHAAPVFSLTFSTDGRRVVSAGDDKSVRLWDVKTGEEIRRFDKDETAGVLSADFSRDGTHILSGSASGKLHLWNAETGELARSFTANSAPGAVNLSPDGRLALTQGKRGIVELWDLQTGEPIRQFRHETGWVWHSAFSPDGKRFLSCGQYGSLRLWDVATGKELCRFETDSAIATSAFSPDGRFAVSAGWDHNVRIWKLPE